MTSEMAKQTTKKISHLVIPDDAKKFLDLQGFKKLYPPQAAAVDAGLLDGQSMLVSAPTASGKTLIAILAIISHLARGGKRVVYMSPLRALATEKYVEFSKLADGFTPKITRHGSQIARPIAIARSTGERGIVMTGGKKIGDADIIVCTNEALDAAMRRGHEWISEVDLVIADEIHLIGDKTRGPTLEMILTQLKQKQSSTYDESATPDNNAKKYGNIQIVGLSATVQNSSEIADWLGCKLVHSDWRPVPLAEGVCDDSGNVVMNDDNHFSVEAGSEGLAARLGVNTISKDNGQCLIFVSTRPSARSTAIRAANLVDAVLSDDDRKHLAKVADKLAPGTATALSDIYDKESKNKKSSNTIAQQRENKKYQYTKVRASVNSESSHSTELEKDLAVLVSKGVAFHHAGLSEKMRQIVEDEFRAGKIKLVASTPTLAAGVNLPARRVVISSMNRYDAQLGRNTSISVLEYKQFCGRAGRPQYDKYGEAIICASGIHYEMYDKYVQGTPEPLESCILDDKAMRTHLLTVVVLNPGITQNGILSFFSDTLGGCQSSKYEIDHIIYVAIKFLLENDMIVSKGDRYAATIFGKKTSSLYVDPVTAAYLRNVVSEAPQATSASNHTLGFLHAITSCDEFTPKQNLLKNHYPLVDALLSGPRRSELLYPVYSEECSRSLLVLHEWVSERTEKEIETAFKTQTGDLHRMVESSLWLVFVLYEMAKIAGRTDLLSEIGILQLRIKSGIKEDLVELASLRGIGRIRARALANAGIRSIEDIQSASPEKLATIRQIGPVVAASIKRATGFTTKRTVKI